jgi:hypothetical protein
VFRAGGWTYADTAVRLLVFGRNCSSLTISYRVSFYTFLSPLFFLINVVSYVLLLLGKHLNRESPFELTRSITTLHSRRIAC